MLKISIGRKYLAIANETATSFLLSVLSMNLLDKIKSEDLIK